MVEAVIFDWGGTLSEWVSITTVDVWGPAARLLVAEADRHPELAEALHEAEARFWARCFDDQRAGCSADIVADALAALGIHGDPQVGATAHHDAWEPHIRHDPDAAHVLGELRRRGIRVGLLSNTHWPGEVHDRHLERDGLLHLFDARVYTSDLAVMKPHPEAFLSALEAVGGARPSSAVFVGDRPYDDIHGAKGVGMKAVLRPNSDVEAHSTEPDATISSLPELLDLVDAWSG